MSHTETLLITFSNSAHVKPIASASLAVPMIGVLEKIAAVEVFPVSKGCFQIVVEPAQDSMEVQRTDKAHLLYNHRNYLEHNGSEHYVSWASLVMERVPFSFQ